MNQKMTKFLLEELFALKFAHKHAYTGFYNIKKG